MATHLVDTLDPESDLSVLVLAQDDFPDALADLGPSQTHVIARDRRHLALTSRREPLSHLVVLETTFKGNNTALFRHQ